MKRPRILPAFLFLLLSVPFAEAASQPTDDYFARVVAGKTTVGSVTFAKNSALLSPETKSQLRELATKIDQMAKPTDFVRVEGWAGLGPAEKASNLAMSRARSAVLFLQEVTKLGRPIYFTGIVLKKGEVGNGNRVDVVLYENVSVNELDSKEHLSAFFD